MSLKPKLAETNKKLARQWHPTKNAPLTPKDIIAGSNIKVWWLCRKGHEWEAPPARRNLGSGCPYCAGQKVYDGNSLFARNPKLAGEWHPTRNAPLTAKHVTAYSNKKVWWKCGKGHEWPATISNRNNGASCPLCLGRKVRKKNFLRTLNPKLASEWHPSRNFPLTPDDVAPNAHVKVWWMCEKGHEWQTAVNNRNKGSGCPYCSGRRACKDNCLQTLDPGLARQWHPAKNMPLTPKNVTVHSNKKARWICKKGHEWEATISSRNRSSRCPFCSERWPTIEDCLKTRAPRIALEWHPTKNASWTPKDVFPYSQRQICWKCKNRHEVRERVIDRYKRGGCPVCELKR